MPVQRPELTTALTNWQQRASFYNQLGIPQSQWYDIATTDVQNVANTGAAPMSTAEVNAAMASQLAGRTIVGNPVHPHHGIFGDIMQAVTSVPHDVGGLITGFLPGMAHFAAHFPSEVTSTAELIRHGDDPRWLTAHGYEDPRTGKSNLGQAAADIRNIAKSPLLSLLPGVADVANLTTGPGRQYLLSHPVTAALDVAPAGKLVGAGSRALTAGAEEGSVLESLRAGKPVQAAGRGVSKGVGKATATDLRPEGVDLRANISNLADRMGVSEWMKQTFRGKSEIDRQASMKTKGLMARLYQMGYFKLSEEEQTQIWRETQMLAPVDPAHEKFHPVLRDIADTLKKAGVATYKRTKGKQGIFTKRHGAGELVFAHDDPIRKHVNRLQQLQSKHLPAAHRRINIGLRRTQSQADKVARLQKELDDARAAIPPMPTGRLERDLADAQARLTLYKTRLVNAVSRRRTLQSELAKSRDAYYNALYKSGGTASMRGLMQTRMREQLTDIRKSQSIKQIRDIYDMTHPDFDPTTITSRVKIALAQLNEDLNTIQHGSMISQIRDAIAPPHLRGLGPEAKAAATQLFNDLKRDVVKNILDLISRGMDPLWLHHVDPGMQYLRHKVSVIPDHTMQLSQYRRTTFNFAPGVQNAAIGLTSAAREFFRAQGTAQFLSTFVLPRAKTIVELDAQFRKIAALERNVRRRPAAYTLSAHASELMNVEWRTIKPEQFGLADWGGYGRFTTGDQLMIPRAMADNLEKLNPGYRSRGEALPLYGAYDKVLKVFRFSVLTGPRHLVHVAVAGMVPLMMESPLAPRYFPDAIRILKEVKQGKHATTYGRLVKNLYDFTDGVANKAAGHQLGLWLQQGWEKTGANVQQRLARVEESVSDIYRISAALAAARTGADIEEQIVAANKVAVDLDDMAPFERGILKHVFPFYGFTRFLFRFLMTYPVDHPYRVSILSRFATQEQQDWNSLLPEKFMMTLFLGHPDQHGNIKTVDLRNLNPFRSFSNDFTIAGFFQQLNPILTAPLTMRGFDVLNATGPLYPSLEFNPVSGTLQAAAPNNALMSGLEQFIPELGSLDHFIGLTDQMRVLKRTNPAAYKAQLYSTLNLPGVLAPPITVNVPYVEEKEEIKRYQAAQQSVSAFEEGKPSPYQPTSFNVVPYQGQYVDPAAFQQYWQQLAAGTGGIDPRALMATPIRRTSQNPLELLTGLGGQLPPPPPTTY
jgi:hypothetical protein